MLKGKNCLSLILISLIMTTLMLSGCEKSFISKTPTAYTMSRGSGGGKIETVYLKPDHPDVLALLPLIEFFIIEDYSQSHDNPDWEVLKQIVVEEFIAKRHETEAPFLFANRITRQVQDCNVERIVFMSKELATATVELEVVFASGSQEFLERYNIRLQEPIAFEASLNLIKTNEEWFIKSVSYVES